MLHGSSHSPGGADPSPPPLSLGECDQDGEADGLGGAAQGWESEGSPRPNTGRLLGAAEGPDDSGQVIGRGTHGVVSAVPSLMSYPSIFGFLA